MLQYRWKGSVTMLLYYIRHGDPIYTPDSLTEQGEKQAEALSKRLADVDFDRIYVSTSNRAYLTAKPTLEKCGKEPIMTDWLNEKVAGSYFWLDKMWIYQNDEYIKILNSESMLDLGRRWSEHECFDGTKVREGEKFFAEKIAELFRDLGYEHDAKNGCFHRTENISSDSEDSGVSDERRIGIFAHGGAGKIFLSTVLGIPYPLFCTHFDLSHSSMSIVYFDEKKETVYPKLLQFSNDSHLYREGLPLRYNNGVKI